MKLRRNQMKLRKNRMKLRKNLPVSSEEFFNSLGGSQTSWGNCRESLRLFVITEYFKIGISRFPLQESSAKGM